MVKNFLLGICLTLLGILLFTSVGSSILADLQYRVRNIDILGYLQGPPGPPGPAGESGQPGEIVFSGATNYDTLELSERLYVTGTSTIATSSVLLLQKPGYRQVGGVNFADIAVAINNATSSSFCSVPNPFWGSTSSLMALGTNMYSTSSVPFNYSISTSTAAFRYGSSTRAFVYDHLVVGRSSGVYDNMSWIPHLRNSTTTTSDAEARGLMYFDNNLTPDGSLPFSIGAFEYVNWNIATGTPGPLGYWRGSCDLSVRRGL